MSEYPKTLDRGLTREGMYGNHPQYKVLNRAVTVDDIIDHGVLTYHLDKVDVYVEGEVGGFQQVPGKKAIVEDRHRHVIQIHNDTYGLTQPFPFVNVVDRLAEVGVECESIGTLKDMGRWYAAFKLEGDIVYGDKTISGYLMLADGCDGTTRSRAGFLLGVPFCTNLINAATLGVNALWAIRHTSKASDYFDTAVRSVEHAIKVQKEVQRTIERMSQQEMGMDEFDRFLIDLNGAPPDEPGRAQTMHDNRTAAMRARFRAEPYGNRYGAFNAVQGYEQHDRTVRGAPREVRHLENVVFDRQALSERAARILQAA